MSDEEEAIGGETFCPENVTVERQIPEVADNRERFLECLQTFDMKLKNTRFKKRPEFLITYKEDKQHLGGEPFVRPTYEVLDCIVIQNR